MVRLNEMVLIHWVDSTERTTGWTFRDEDDYTLIHISTAGFLIDETDDCYVISHSIGFEGSHFNSFMIPKGCVKEFIKLEDNSGSKKQGKGKSSGVQDSPASGEIRFKG